MANVGWFVLLTVGSGLVAYVQDALGLRAVPVQALARIWVVLVVVTVALVGAQGSFRLDVRLKLPLIAFGLSVAASFLNSLRNMPLSEAVDEFGFMYGTGILLCFFLIAPMAVRLGRVFRIFCAVSVGFGAFQAFQQDLFLPDAFRERFGIVYSSFVNGDVRVLGFFASPPRFAELLVFIAAYLQYFLISGHRRAWLSLAAYAIVLFTLYNTYSRSGFVLFACTLLVQVILMRRYFFAKNLGGALRTFGVLGVGSVGFAGFASGRVLTDSAVADSTSLSARQVHWGNLLDQLKSLDLLGVLFGSGRSARFSALSEQYFVVDNLILAVLLYGGVVGTAAFVWLYFRLLKVGLQSTSRRPPPREYLAPFYLALVVEGMFVDNHNTVFVVQFVLLGMLFYDRISNPGLDNSGSFGPRFAGSDLLERRPPLQGPGETATRGKLGRAK